MTAHPICCRPTVNDREKTETGQYMTTHNDTLSVKQK
jgi:hypothetical protein